MSISTLQFNGVAFNYSNDYQLFKNIDFTVDQGDFVLIKGASGAGKSTILRLICRLEEISAGTILYNGTDINTISPQQLRTNIMLVQQTPNMVEGTIKDNLLLPLSFKANKSLPQPSDDEISKMLAKFQLDVPLTKEAKQLSVGQLQRLSIIRSLMLDPCIILMDEPTSALDLESREIVENIAEQLNKEGKTILMINHSEYVPSCKHKILNVSGGNALMEDTNE